MVYTVTLVRMFCFFFFKQKTAYEMHISDWSSDVCSSDLAERIVLVFRSGDIFGDSVDGPDFMKHIESSFVGAAMSRTPKAGDTCRDAGEGVCAGRTSKPNSRCRRVLLVIGMEEENLVIRVVHRLEEGRVGKGCVSKG